MRGGRRIARLAALALALAVTAPGVASGQSPRNVDGSSGCPSWPPIWSASGSR